MTVTIISPYSDITAYGVRILSATMKQAGIQTRLIFLSDYQEPDNDIETIIMYKEHLFKEVIALCADSDLIGISLFSCHFPFVADLTKRIKENLKAPVIWGGKHSSARPLESLEFADIVCIGEGEEAIVELVQKLKTGGDIYSIRNLWFKKNGEIVKNPLRPLTQNISTRPYPDYSLDEHVIWDKENKKMLKMDKSILERFMWKEPGTGLIPYQSMASLGCPYNCSYCFTFKEQYKGQKYLRFRLVDNIIEELEKIKYSFPFIGKITLLDDNFFAWKNEDIANFAKAYKEKIGLPLRCLAHPFDVSYEKLALLIEAGLTHVQMGIQTGSNETKKIYNRPISNTAILKAVNTLNQFKHKIVPFYDFIIDNPYETHKDVLKTLNLILKFPKPYHLNIFSLSFYPGTKLYDKAMQDGILFDETKEWKSREKSFENLIFLLFNYPIPKLILRFLLCSPIFFILGHPLVSSAAYRIAFFVKKVAGK